MKPIKEIWVMAKRSFSEKNRMRIAEKIKRLRIDKGYTSYENFAYENDLSRVQYWRMERGTNFTIDYLLRILEIHKMSLSKFFNDFD
ncbi:MAG: helix-turn-helix domain-containing protein [Bacteroidota bacterium]